MPVESPRTRALLLRVPPLSSVRPRVPPRLDSPKERARHALQEGGHAEIGGDGRVVGRLGRVAHLGEG
eukprot:scaffold74295_cov43-Phaeocystis_antarctica.AAC.1